LASTEFHFLLLAYLKASPYADVAELLQQRFSEAGALPERWDWQGQSHPLSFEELVCHRRIKFFTQPLFPVLPNRLCFSHSATIVAFSGPDTNFLHKNHPVVCFPLFSSAPPTRTTHSYFSYFRFGL
jgi:hypothetical protein